MGGGFRASESAGTSAPCASPASLGSDVVSSGSVERPGWCEVGVVCWQRGSGDADTGDSFGLSFRGTGRRRDYICRLFLSGW